MATVQPNAKSDKGVKTELHEIFEKRLFLWIVATTNENGVMLGGEFIKEKAKEIAKELNISDHKFSDGWLQGFLRRHDLHYRKCHGEKKSP